MVEELQEVEDEILRYIQEKEFWKHEFSNQRLPQEHVKGR